MCIRVVMCLMLVVWLSVLLSKIGGTVWHAKNSVAQCGTQNRAETTLVFNEYFVSNIKSINYNKVWHGGTVARKITHRKTKNVNI